MSHKKTPPKAEYPTRNSSFFGFRMRSQIASPSDCFPACVSIVFIRLAYQLQHRKTAVFSIEAANRSLFAPQSKKRLQRGKLTCPFKDAGKKNNCALRFSVKPDQYNPIIVGVLVLSPGEMRLRDGFKGILIVIKASQFITVVPKRLARQRNTYHMYGFN